MDKTPMNTFPFPGHDMLLPDIVRAENCSLYDSEGKRYVDLESGIWCTAIGHGHPDVKAAISRQMDDVAHIGFCYSSPVVEKAAGTVLELLNHDGGRCSFLCSGSEAVEYGMRALRTALPQTTIMTMGDSYFGAYGDAANKGEEGWFVFDWFECGDCGHEFCSEACSRWASIPFNNIGGFLFEPGSSSGQVRFPPVQLIKGIAGSIHDSGGLVMVNEVTTGFGRTGEWFGFQHYGFQPDIVAMGKGIGNGYPVSATSINARVIEKLGPAPVPYGQSHLNDPLGAAVAQAVIKTIAEDNLIERAAGLSKLLLDGLGEIASNSPHVQAVRGRGLMAIMELVDDPDHSRAEKLHRELIANGFIVVLRPASSMFRMDPALTIDETDVVDFLGTLKRLLGAL